MKKPAIKVYNDEDDATRFVSWFLEYTADYEQALDPACFITVGPYSKALREHDAKVEQWVADVEARGHKAVQGFDDDYYPDSQITCSANLWGAA